MLNSGMSDQVLWEGRNELVGSSGPGNRNSWRGAR